jgi:ABC-2 type transport system permease protein
MAGLSVIIKKEISDAFSSRVFLISLMILLVSCMMTGATSNRKYIDMLNWAQALAKNTGWDYVVSTAGLVIINELIPHIKVLGAFVAIAYGFNAFNKEHTEESLKVLLSYPIYRDQIILGKLISGFLLVSLVTLSSLFVALSIYLYSTNISFSPDLTLRFSAFTLLSIFFLSGYLGLSMFFSIAFKDQKTTLLVMFLLIGLFNSYAFYSTGRILSDVVYGSERNPNDPYVPMNIQALNLRESIKQISPSYSYESISRLLSHHSITVQVGDKQVLIPSNAWSVIMHNLGSILVLVIIPVLTFAASYVLFTRRDIT